MWVPGSKLGLPGFLREHFYPWGILPAPNTLFINKFFKWGSLLRQRFLCPRLDLFIIQTFLELTLLFSVLNDSPFVSASLVLRWQVSSNMPGFRHLTFRNKQQTQEKSLISKGSVVLGTVLLRWKDTLVKATYKRKHVIGSLLQFHRVSSWSSWQGHHGRECGSREAGVMLEQWLRTCVYKQREKLSLVWALETSETTSSDTPHPPGPHLLTFPRQSTWEANIQVQGPFLVKPPQRSFIYFSLFSP